MNKTPEEKQGCEASRLAEEFVNIESTGSDTFAHGLRNGYLAGYQAAAPQWISVKDRLPEDISDVLILTKEKELCVGYYRNSDNDWNMYNPCCSFHMELHGVTHWMPLPKPPEDK